MLETATSCCVFPHERRVTLVLRKTSALHLHLKHSFRNHLRFKHDVLDVLQRYNRSTTGLWGEIFFSSLIHEHTHTPTQGPQKHHKLMQK